MNKSVDDITKEMQAEIRDTYHLSPEDAKKLFVAIWHNMTMAGRFTGTALDRAVTRVEDGFNIV